MGYFSDLAAAVKARLNPKTIAAEAFATVTGRLIPQGAAEIAQALYTQGTAYVPYGQEPMAVEAAEAIGLAAPEAASPEPAPTTQQQYQANLALYAGRSTPGIHHTPSL